MEEMLLQPLFIPRKNASGEFSMSGDVGPSMAFLPSSSRSQTSNKTDKYFIKQCTVSFSYLIEKREECI